VKGAATGVLGSTTPKAAQIESISLVKIRLFKAEEDNSRVGDFLLQQQPPPRPPFTVLGEWPLRKLKSEIYAAKQEPGHAYLRFPPFPRAG